jgi:hypothetical protein
VGGDCGDVIDRDCGGDRVIEWEVIIVVIM